MRKVWILCMLLMGIFAACSKTDDNQYQEETIAPYGIKPVIYYHEKLYEIAESIEQLPKEFIDSGDIIIESEENPSTIPNQECYTSNFNANNVGATIYINPNDDNTIYINVKDWYVAFRNGIKK